MRFVLLLSILGLSHGQRQPKLQDLYESLDTPSRIWLVLQTYPPEIHGRQVACISYKKTDLTRKSYYFARFYRHWNREHHENLFGTLSGRGFHSFGPTLTTYKLPVTGQGKNYTLIYWCPDELCAIFETRHYGKRQCQMRVWNEAIHKPLRGCRKVFKQYCPQWRHYRVYYAWCKPRPRK